MNKAQVLTLDSLPDALNTEPEIVLAAEKLRVMGLDTVEKRIYEGELKAMLVYRTELRVAREEGLAEGKEEGREEGVDEGLHKALRMMVESGMAEEEAKRILSLP